LPILNLSLQGMKKAAHGWPWAAGIVWQLHCFSGRDREASLRLVWGPGEERDATLAEGRHEALARGVIPSGALALGVTQCEARVQDVIPSGVLARGVIPSETRVQDVIQCAALARRVIQCEALAPGVIPSGARRRAILR
jgi:hypothetical protein